MTKGQKLFEKCGLRASVKRTSSTVAKRNVANLEATMGISG